MSEGLLREQRTETVLNRLEHAPASVSLGSRRQGHLLKPERWLGLVYGFSEWVVEGEMSAVGGEVCAKKLAWEAEGFPGRGKGR